ncbi:MAG: hypothetical protein Q8Q28_05265 [Pseudomonadota bacterium]|nr:hypothetical protein [Pseudomonadota bacterium]
MPAPKTTVIPANAGIQFVGLIALKINQMDNLDFRVRGNDDGFFRRLRLTHDI